MAEVKAIAYYLADLEEALADAAGICVEGSE
jgi:hypothetical protein